MSRKYKVYAGIVEYKVCWNFQLQGIHLQYSQVQGTLLKYRYTVVNGLLVYIVKCKVYADFEVFVLYTCYIYFKENTYCIT